ncbi:hypothetical protein Ancab_031277 [Ancistrocladus abbreviatus]
MSRCFPFPPPGYDKKGRADDPDLIKKERHRQEKHGEKKHKKEKRDKDKKDGKEKQERDRRDEKHREKKDKKEKHRGKKKAKEKDRDKSKNNKILSEEKRVAGQSEGYNVEKPKERNTDWEKNKSIGLDEKRIAGHSTVHNGEELNRNSHLAAETNDFKYVQELPSRIRNEEWRTSNQLQEKHVTIEQRKDEGMFKFPDESAATLVDGTERKKEKGQLVTTEQRKGEGMFKLPCNGAAILVNGTEPNKENKINDGKTGIEVEARPSGGALVHNRVEARPSGNALVHNRVEARPGGNTLVHKSTEMFPTRVEGLEKPVEKYIDWRMDGREKVREKDADGKKSEKQKDKDKDRAGKKDKHREKEKKKEKMKERERRHIEQLNIKDGSKSCIEHSRVGDANMSNHLGSQGIKLQNLPNETEQTAAAHENIRKRKELGSNGVVHEGDVGPKKMARTLSSSHPLTQNGRSLDPCQASIIFAPDMQQTSNNVKPDSKECKLNGIVDGETIKGPPQPAAHADLLVEASRKPPHPDAKYLGEVLSVPKMDEWSDFDDQGWLFSRNLSQLKDMKMETSGVDEAPQVWAEALQIESADVVALPYVIPL